jgi:hypothetical protein
LGDWIVKNPEGTGYYPVSAAEFRALYVEADEDGKLPGVGHMTLVRVGFRRREGDGYEFRHAGLTRAEMRHQGWEALYVMNTGDE